MAENGESVSRVTSLLLTRRSIFESVPQTGSAAHNPGMEVPMADAPATSAPSASETIRRKARLYFSLFALFFVFYVGTAVIQTPELRSVAATPFLGMPLGLFLSLAIFPVSWILIAVFFVKGK
jgi:uncharacterized membrane protein (DUF485 family)